MARKTVTVEYDENDGNLYQGDFCVAHIGFGIEFKDDEASAKASSGPEALVQLKGAGFTAQEIMQMKREGLI